MFRLLPINGYDTKERAEINFNVLKRKKQQQKGRSLKGAAPEIVSPQAATWFACAVASAQGVHFNHRSVLLANTDKFGPSDEKILIKSEKFRLEIGLQLKTLNGKRNCTMTF
jgi:hypothetical protein